NGCPAFAISQEYYAHPDFSLAARAAATVARNILEHGLSPGELINVNVPAVTDEEYAGIEVTRLGKRIYQDQLLERLDARGIPYYWIGGPPPSGLAVEGTDFAAIVNRRIAVTPIQLDLTARRLLTRLRSWDWQSAKLTGARVKQPVEAARPEKTAPPPAGRRTSRASARVARERSDELEQELAAEHATERR